MVKPKVVGPEPLPAVPAPQALACLGCRYGHRYVDVVDVEKDSDDGEEWKPPIKKIEEGYNCEHPLIVTGDQRSMEVVGRIFCALREEKAV
jgi:hypothetical protein